MELQKGDKAPEFTAKDQDGNTISLKDFRGKKVALYFYPEDDTPVCTVQACNLRDNYALLKEKGITILGVSPNDITSHKKFEKKFSLPFPLIADTDLKIANKYGVWAEKVLYGHRHMGIVRSTFLIDEKGKIEHIIKRALSKTHTDQILKGWGMV
ncbi:MAG: peroxiredoxin [Bacteroidetes bacterium 43-93]|nr:thioredoxin-dependent thiol peroxidase [Bacteroidota bacterium]MBS1779083.1 thioredoxin-dependent thiol peroxidase [Bacteroidota bacterium]OJW96352.1 MAG: peroxiredoxin [Bacteroidetes bacterium 43-93]